MMSHKAPNLPLLSSTKHACGLSLTFVS